MPPGAGSIAFFLEALADSEDVTVWMPHVHLANIQGMSVGGQVTSRPCSRQWRCTASTSSTQIDNPHATFKAARVDHLPARTVCLSALLPRLPWAFAHSKIVTLT